MINKWEVVFDEPVLNEIIKLLGDDATEDIDTLKDIIEYLSANVDYDKALVIAKSTWNDYDDYHQILISLVLLEEEGEMYLSRFMIIMDFLSGKLGNRK